MRACSWQRRSFRGLANGSCTTKSGWLRATGMGAESILREVRRHHGRVQGAAPSQRRASRAETSSRNLGTRRTFRRLRPLNGSRLAVCACSTGDAAAGPPSQCQLRSTRGSCCVRTGTKPAILFCGGCGSAGSGLLAHGGASAICVEMECSALFIVGTLRRVRTGAIVAIDGDARVAASGKHQPRGDLIRQAIDREIEIALDAVAHLASAMHSAPIGDSRS